MSRRTRLYCSFCGKSQVEVLKLFAGPAGEFICNECVALLAGQLTEDEKAGGPPPPSPQAKTVRIDWAKLPHHQTHGPR